MFPLAKRGEYGYEPKSVDQFLGRARVSFESPNTVANDTFTSKTIRQVSFKMKKRGYSPFAVDGALERLEDAFVARELAGEKLNGGTSRSVQEYNFLAIDIGSRCSRPDRERFTRVNFLAQGYDVVAVDRFMGRVQQYLASQWPMRAADVRNEVFAPKRGGYSELQVDIFLDAVVELILNRELIVTR